jgi:hypothetical protein
MSIFPTTERPSALKQGRLTVSRLGVPWKTVVALAAVMAYADGFWLTSLRSAVGAIERTQAPFASWLRESTIVLPVYVLAVLGAMTLALRWFGPVLRKPKTVLATALLIVAAGTVVGLAATVASSAYDYHLQSAQLQLMQAMSSIHGGCSASCLAQEQHDTLAIHVRAVVLISRWLLLTNVLLVAWLLAMWGGRLKVATTRRQPEAPTDTATDTATDASTDTATATVTGRSRVQDVRLLLVGALVASAAVHAAVIPEHLSEWPAAGLFFVVLAAAELVVAGLLVARVQPRTVLVAASVISIGPLVLWLWSRTVGMPFGPGAGVPESVGLPDFVACALEAGTLLAAVALLRAPGRPARPGSAHVRGLILVGLIAVTAIGLAGTGPSWFDVFGISGSPSVMDMSH